MNTGVISIRYARALLALVSENGTGEKVCREAITVLYDDSAMPETLSSELESLVALLKRNGRLDYLKFILMSFIKLYFQQQKIHYARLYSVKQDEALEERIRKMLEDSFGGQILLESYEEPDLVGGFVLKLDDLILDASVRHQFDLLRSEFNTVNNRIV